MIVLKHLAQQFNIDPYTLRHILRRNRYTPNNRRWKWEENDPQLKQIRETLSNYLNSRSSTLTHNTTASSTPPIVSTSTPSRTPNSIRHRPTAS